MEEENNCSGDIYQNTKESERTGSTPKANPSSPPQNRKDSISILDRGSGNEEDRILRRGDLARIIGRYVFFLSRYLTE